ncbi:low affinity sulphate transporter 3 [Clostridium fallax]|uniref:Sulfate permease, SulP family n=1 Tax=Clostridium fallax TaxID=1533 RepID=A0A1M4W973_9CLOT|nr:sulfate permease, SulP family [Clostridium fallax]SQB05945.1 low affinity sulphate transporter 3 [Clostridium fallax]
MYKPTILKLIKNKELTKEQIIKDIIAGIIVAIIALPLSVALGISSGVSPEKGLITAIIAGLCISLFGGSRVQIGGPTGAFVIIIYGIIEKYGLEGLVVSTFMAGVILIIFGLLKLGDLIKYIPRSVTIGFTAGIGVTLFSTQVKDFLGMGIDKVPSSFISKWCVYLSNINLVSFWSMALGVISLLIIVFWSKINKTIPGSLIALIVGTLLAFAFKLPVSTIGSQFGEISSSFPTPKLPILNINTVKTLIAPAFTIALLAAIESLLSAVVSDKMIDCEHDSNSELIGQGIGSIMSSIFGGIPATGAIARTAANVKNGGRTPIAGIVHAIILLLIMKILMPLIKYVPLTTLAAILLVVSYNMSEVKAFSKLLFSSKIDLILLLVTFILTLVCDLVVAIGVAMVIYLMYEKALKYTPFYKGQQS